MGIHLNLVKILSRTIILIRCLKYRILSTCNNIYGKPICLTPTLINGCGKVYFANNVNIGVRSSPSFYNTYCYFEARNSESVISFGDDVFLNNNATIISEGQGIFISENVLIGSNFTAYDSNFHNLDPLKRLEKDPFPKKVIVERNVFIGSNVTVLKGVIIGENSIIGSNSVVSMNIPANVIAVGNPCKEIKKIQSN